VGAAGAGADVAVCYAWLYRLALDCLIEAHRRESRDARDPHREPRWPEHSSVQLGLSLIGTGTRWVPLVVLDQCLDSI
jgi:hypothetical protein